MRKSGIIIGLLLFSIFQGIGITRTQGLTEVIYEGDWVVDTDTIILETDLNITVTNNLIVKSSRLAGRVMLLTYSRINVLGDVIVGDITGGEILEHHAALNIYGDLIIYQKVRSHGDLYVENTIRIEGAGTLGITKLYATNVILSEGGIGSYSDDNPEIEIAQNLNIELGGGASFINSTVVVGGDINVHSSSSFYLADSTLKVGGNFNSSSNIGFYRSNIFINETLYLFDYDGRNPYFHDRLFVDNSVLNIWNSLKLHRPSFITDSEIIQSNPDYNDYFLVSTGYHMIIKSSKISSFTAPISNEANTFIFENSSIEYDGPQYAITSNSEWLFEISNCTFDEPARIYNSGATVFENNTGFLDITYLNLERKSNITNNQISGNLRLQASSPQEIINVINNSLSYLSVNNVTNIILTNNTVGEASFRDIIDAEIFNNSFSGTVTFDGKLDSVIIQNNNMVDVGSSNLDLVNTIVTENSFGGTVTGISLIPFPDAIYPGTILDLSSLGIQFSYSFNGAEKVSGATEIVFPEAIGTHEIWLDVSSGSNIFIGSFMIEIVEEPVSLVTTEPITPSETQTNGIETIPKTDESPASLYSPLWYLVTILSMSIIRKRK